MSEKGRLLSHFQDATESTQGSKWDELWEGGEQELWDRGHASPALKDYVWSPESLLAPLLGRSSLPRALVPGCGTGYDPVMLAQRGFDAWGLELSAKAVDTAKEYARSIEGNSQIERIVSVNIEAGKVNFIQGDFFANEWQLFLPFTDGKFDLVYDYTFLCALLPESRKCWAKRMVELVRPGGFLICLEFPLWKDNELPGPPWGLSGVYWDLLAEGGDGLVNSNSASCVGAGKGSFERVQYIKPAVSFKQGRGTDMLSVWRRKDPE